MAGEAELLEIWHLRSQCNVQKRTISPFCEIELILGESVVMFFNWQWQCVMSNQGVRQHRKYEMLPIIKRHRNVVAAPKPVIFYSFVDKCHELTNWEFSLISVEASKNLCCMMGDDSICRNINLAWDGNSKMTRFGDYTFLILKQHVETW